MVKKIILLLAVLLVVSFIVIQFFQPEKNIQEITESHILHHSNLSDDVKLSLKNACFDCHSNNSAYSWYHKIAPVSWYAYGHIKEAKEVLNFSEWEDYSKLEKIGLLDEISEDAKDGKMPLKSYSLIHKKARLSAKEIEAISDWAESYAEELLTGKK